MENAVGLKSLVYRYPAMLATPVMLLWTMCMVWGAFTLYEYVRSSAPSPIVFLTLLAILFVGAVNILRLENWRPWRTLFVDQRGISVVARSSEEILVPWEAVFDVRSGRNLAIEVALTGDLVEKLKPLCGPMSWKTAACPRVLKLQKDNSGGNWCFLVAMPPETQSRLVAIIRERKKAIAADFSGAKP